MLLAIVQYEVEAVVLIAILIEYSRDSRIVKVVRVPSVKHWFDCTQCGEEACRTHPPHEPPLGCNVEEVSEFQEELEFHKLCVAVNELRTCVEQYYWHHVTRAMTLACLGLAKRLFDMVARTLRDNRYYKILWNCLYSRKSPSLWQVESMQTAAINQASDA